MSGGRRCACAQSVACTRDKIPPYLAALASFFFRFLPLPVEMSDDEGSPPSPKRSRTGEETPKSGDGPKGKGKLTANQESGDLRTIIRETLLDVLKEKEDARPSTLRDPPRTLGERWTGRRVITYLHAGRVGGGRYGKQGHWLVGAVCHNGGQKVKLGASPQ